VDQMQIVGKNMSIMGGGGEEDLRSLSSMEISKLVLHAAEISW